MVHSIDSSATEEVYLKVSQEADRQFLSRLRDKWERFLYIDSSSLTISELSELIDLYKDNYTREDAIKLGERFGYYRPQ